MDVKHLVDREVKKQLYSKEYRMYLENIIRIEMRKIKLKIKLSED